MRFLQLEKYYDPFESDKKQNDLKMLSFYTNGEIQHGGTYLSNGYNPNDECCSTAMLTFQLSGLKYRSVFNSYKTFLLQQFTKKIQSYESAPYLNGRSFIKYNVHKKAVNHKKQVHVIRARFSQNRRPLSSLNHYKID